MVKYALIVLLSIVVLSIEIVKDKTLFKKGEKKSFADRVVSIEAYIVIALGLYGLIMLIVTFFEQ